MKASKALFIYGLVFAISVAGVLIVLTQASAITADVFCTPWYISLEDMGPEQFVIRIMLPDDDDHENIDPESIRIEGFDVTKEDPDWPKVKRRYFKYLADGSKVMMWIVYPAVWHMAPAPGEFIYLELTLTGELYGGPSFEGTFTLRVMAEHNDNSVGVPPFL